MATFTVHVGLAGRATHAIDVEATDTLQGVVDKAAGALRVDPRDIILRHEGAAFGDLAVGVTQTALVEGSEVEASPVQGLEQRRKLREIGVEWGTVDEIVKRCKAKGDKVLSEVMQLVLDADEGLTADDVKEAQCDVAEKGMLETVKVLCSRGISDEGPLHFAAGFGSLPVVKYLVEQGANLEAEGAGGRTPLHYAAAWGHLSVARYLVEQGADKNARSSYDDSPACLAEEYRHGDVADFLYGCERGSSDESCNLDDLSDLGYPGPVVTCDHYFEEKLYIGSGSYMDYLEAGGEYEDEDEDEDEGEGESESESEDEGSVVRVLKRKRSPSL